MSEDERDLISNPKLKVPFPNKLFLKWIEKWYTEAKRRDLQSQYCYAKAIDSLLRYPLPLECPKEALILKSIGKIFTFLEKLYLGPGIAEKLEKEWKKYLDKNPEYVLSSALKKAQRLEMPLKTSTKSTTKTRLKKYIPKYKSINYGILLSLLSNKSLSRAEIIIKAQQYCDIHHTKFQTNINTLLKNELVLIVPERVVHYKLTNTGIELAQKLYNAYIEISRNKTNLVESNLLSQNNEVIEIIDNQLFNNNVIENKLLNNLDFNYCLLKDSFDIILLVDQIELNNNPKILSMLGNHIKYEIRKLNIGDFLWIAKSTTSKMEILLDFLIERKTIQDLSSSIIDGRFHEQKCRISYSNIKQAIYLVEGNLSSSSNNSVPGGILPEQSLMQAISNTVIKSGFIVKKTKSFQETVNYLLNVTKYLENKYKNCNITASSDGKGQLQPFQYFNDQSLKSKLLTNQEMMMAMIMQIKGVSFEKALGISKEYPTFKHLYRAFQDFDVSHPQDLNLHSNKRTKKKKPQRKFTLSNIMYQKQVSSKKLGKAISEYIYQMLFLSNQSQIEP